MNRSAVNNSFARGYVFGQTRVSGSRVRNGEQIGVFVGVSGAGSSVQNVYSTGVVESGGARRIGPFIGHASGRLSANGINFFNTDSAHHSSVRTQSMANITPNAGLQGRSTWALWNQDTFANWNFNGVWSIASHTYPYFRTGSIFVSTQPIIHGVMVGDTAIQGFGHSQQAEITVLLPDGTALAARTNGSLEWSVNVPRGYVFNEHDVVTARQKETNLPISADSTVYVQIERLIDISADIDFESQSSRSDGSIVAGDRVRFSVTINNDGNESHNASQLQVSQTLPAGLTLVPGSVRYVVENDDGDEIFTNIAQNTSGTGTRGHSFNAASRFLEIRLGSFSLNGGESVVVEFDVTIDAGIRGAEIGPITSRAQAYRVSRNSDTNIFNVTATSEILYVD
jgi:uncharacterized repeat protein (TIGR01451 family)